MLELVLAEAAREPLVEPDMHADAEEHTDEDALSVLERDGVCDCDELPLMHDEALGVALELDSADSVGERVPQPEALLLRELLPHEVALAVVLEHRVPLTDVESLGETVLHREALGVTLAHTEVLRDVEMLALAQREALALEESELHEDALPQRLLVGDVDTEAQEVAVTVEHTLAELDAHTVNDTLPQPEAEGEAEMDEEADALWHTDGDGVLDAQALTDALAHAVLDAHVETLADWECVELTHTDGVMEPHGLELRDAAEVLVTECARDSDGVWVGDALLHTLVLELPEALGHGLEERVRDRDADEHAQCDGVAL